MWQEWIVGVVVALAAVSLLFFPTTTGLNLLGVSP